MMDRLKPSIKEKIVGATIAASTIAALAGGLWALERKNQASLVQNDSIATERPISTPTPEQP